MKLPTAAASMHQSPSADASPIRQRRRLRNEIGVILVLKVVALTVLFQLFFSGHDRGATGPGEVARHLLPETSINQQ
jgi:hypothetical protein